MGLGIYRIFLDNPVYFPGQTVTGRIHVNIKNEVKILSGIELHCKGTAHVRISNIDENSSDYQASENYFQKNIGIIGRPPSGTIRLEVGDHIYPFSFQLPTDIPSSFEGQNSYVRYTIKCVLMRDMKWNHYCKIGFTVNTIVDLNSSEEAMLPASVAENQTPYSCCRKLGTITASIWLDRTGYVPGEIIQVNAKVENLSGLEMMGSKLLLVECSTLYVRKYNEKKTHSRVISQKAHSGFTDSDNWANEPITIPPIVPSGLPYCNIIDVNYQLRYVVEHAWMRNKIVVSLNLIIGNVPLVIGQNSVQQQDFDRVSIPPPTPSSLPDYGALMSIIDNYPAPPSYEECVFPGTDIRESDDSTFVNNGTGEVHFRPLYLSYNSVTA